MRQLSVPEQSQPLDLQHILTEMDQALADEIVRQINYRQVKHTAIDGKLISEGNGQYIYLFTLTEPWEPQDDTPLIIANKNAQNNSCTVVNSKGTTITIASGAPLSPDVLRQIDFCDDSTELLKRLQESLKHVDEGSAKLGSKSFGLLPYRENNTPSMITFGSPSLHPYPNQMKAAQMALGGEVTYIVGPPGTGKTLTLAAIAFEHLRAGRTVLIASHTNIAVDNAIMKLCDLCKETNNKLLLEQGMVVRYGAVQKAELMDHEQYAEVSLKKIAQRLGVTLHSQSESLKISLHDLDRRISELQRQPLHEEWFQSQSALIRRQVEILRIDLVPLEQEERQRISKLQSQRNQFMLDIQTVEHELMDAHLQLARNRAEIEEIGIALTGHRQDEQKWLAQLVDARAMSKVKRFFKGVKVEKLELKVAEATQGIRETNQKLASLRQELEVRHATLSQCKQKKQFCEEAFNRIHIELVTPSNAANNIQRLSEQINVRQRSLSEIEATHKHQQRAYQQDTQNLAAQRSVLENQLATFDQQLRDVEQSIVAQAHVVGTTLSKTYMNKTIAGRRFDAVILDEVSMAPLPLVYIATSHADSSVTLIGDPQQLAPIVAADTPIAKKWLGHDLFGLRGISLDAATGGINHSVMLDVQSRMHPQISAIAIKYVYGKDQYGKDRLKNGNQQPEKIEPLREASLILCDTSDASPIVSKPTNGRSRKNYYHALCSIALARKVLADPGMKAKSEPCIGIVTPYRAQALLLQKLILDTHLQNQVQAGTVHRFQGLEFDVVIFDTVESRGMKPAEFISGAKDSDSMRLINVAVTRPKHKLIIVANRTHIQREMSAQSTLHLVVKEAADAATVQSLDYVGIPFASFNSANIEKEVFVLPPVKNREDGDLESFTEKTFYRAVKQDIRGAQKSIIIASPFLAQERVNDILPLLIERQRRDVIVKVYTKPPEESEQWSIGAADLVKAAGIELLYRPKMHEKLVFIDEKVVYIGSLNLLSHRDTRESVLRVPILSIVQEQLSDLLDSGEEHQKKIFVDDATLQEMKEVEISVKSLPSTDTRCGCGSPLVPRPRNDGSGAFYGCSNYRACSQKSTESISLAHLRQIKSLQELPCPRCGSLISLQLQNRPDRVLLVCDAKCGEIQKISFTK